MNTEGGGRRRGVIEMAESELLKLPGREEDPY